MFPGLDGGASFEQLVHASDGGRVCLSDGSAHIDIPPGALDHDTVISIARADGAPEAAGDRRVVLPGYDFGPDGTHFALPARVTLHVTPPAGVALGDLGMLAVSSDGSTEELPGVVADARAGTISAPVSHFTVFFGFVRGPAAIGRGIQVGGRGLTPLFATSTSSAPTYVSVWLGPDGKVRNDAYSSVSADALEIRIDTGTPGAGRAVYVDDWVVDPVDPDPSAVSPITGERILTTEMFWYRFLHDIAGPLRTQATDADGRISVVIDGRYMQTQVTQWAPIGYSSGRVHIRALSPDAASSADVWLAFALSPEVPR